MPVHTLYVTNTTAITPNWFSILQDGGSAPSAVNTDYGFGSTDLAGFNGAHLGATGTSTDYGSTSFISATTGPTKGTGSGPTTAGDSFIAGPFSGSIPNTPWTFNWNVRTTGIIADGCIRMRVWKSANADGSAATELTTSTLVGTVVSVNNTTSDFNSSISWSPGVLFVSNEYLFFQVEWNTTVSHGAGGSPVLFRAGTASITTPDIGTIVTTTGTAAGTSTAVGHYDTIFTQGTAAGSSAVNAAAIRAQTINVTGLAAGTSTARAGLTSRHVVWRVVGLPSAKALTDVIPGDWNSDFSNDFNVYSAKNTSVLIKTMWKVA